MCYCSLDDSDMKEWYMYMCVCLCVYILYKSLYLLFFCQNECWILPVFRIIQIMLPYSGWAFLGLLTDLGGTGAKSALPLNNMSHTSYIDETQHSYTLPKEESKKYINHVTHPLTHISIFSPKISNFQYIRKYRYRLHFNAYIPDLTNSFESSKIFLVSMVEF